MSKCELAIVFDKSDATYVSREKVKGHVKVDVNESVRADRVNFCLIWQTHGKGNRDWEEVASTHLGPFEWRAGQTEELPFELSLPARPVSYSGKYLNVEWKVKVDVDIPWAFDPKHETTFTVRPESPMSVSAARLLMPKDTSARHRWLGLAILIFMFIAGLSVMVPAAMSFSELGSQGGQPIFYVVFLLIWFGGLVFVALRIAKPWVAELKTGRITVSPEKTVLCPGDDLKVTVGFKTRRKMHLNGSRLSLIMREKVISGSGTNQQTHTNDQLVTRAVLSGSESLDPGTPYREDCVLKIPVKAPSSFSADNNDLMWVLVCELDIENWPDTRDEVYVAMR